MKDKSLEKYQKLRKEKITFFGGSVRLDWLMMNLFALIIMIIVFVYSYLEIREIIFYEPVADQSTYGIINDDKVLKDLDRVINSLEVEKESNEVISDDIEEGEIVE